MLPIPTKSFFLLGPRATGKSTWLRDQVKPDFMIDLLRSRDFRDYSTDLNLLREVIEANPKYKVVVIDEIQKLPELLDEVHSLIFDFKNKIQFILTGSSARKLKKNNVNLLAGRALVRNFHQFSYLEIKEQFDLVPCLKFGMLPEVWNLETEAEKKDYLFSYVDTYLKEEIQQEAAVRNLPSYIKFLEHFSFRNSKVINLQNISSEIGVARTTIVGYLEILEQTLLGFKISPLHLKAKVKEVSTPKFYFFDTGVVRGLSKNLDQDLEDQKGSLFETYVLQEIRTYSDYFQARFDIHYWGTPGQNEVDFVLSKGRIRVGIEVKSSRVWSKDFNRGLKTLIDAGKIRDAYGVYLGQEVIQKDGVLVYPIKKFVEALFQGKIL
ncbi:MAG: ATP-binding protein [Pseudobdellovibrionaceae bacterium]